MYETLIYPYYFHLYLLTYHQDCLTTSYDLILCHFMKIFKSSLREVSAVYKKHQAINNIKISSSNDVNEFIRLVFSVVINIREAMLVLFLNNSNRTLGYSVVSIGGITATVVDVRLILRDALLTQSTNIITIHNHPSGNLVPSQADLSISEKVLILNTIIL